MADIIQLLPDNIANQIAAGEVIQRPASVAKELMENALDAGSDEIKLIIKDSGKTLIQVVDNGKGMSPTDARLCFERHATSKIREAKDLFAIKTMGFRGEAMASIAAIARVELITKQSTSNTATYILIEGSEVKKQETTQSTEGTNISVKNLFFNVPARRKFLKSDPVELKHINQEFLNIALANPEVNFSMYHNGNELYRLPAGNLKQRIVYVFGKNYSEKIVPVHQEANDFTLSGFVGKPEFAKRSKGEQYFFVNKRFIKSPYLSHAIKIGYENLISSDLNPFFILNIELNPDKIDINVHPTKTEIKFDDERLIYNYIKVAIRQAIGQYSLPTIDFDNNVNFGIQRDQKIPSQSDNYNPIFKREMSELSKDNLKAWEKMYDGLSTEKITDEKDIPLTLESSMSQGVLSSFTAGEQDNKDPMQLHNMFIISQIKSGFLLLDQQAAHERILYEKQLDLIKNGQRLVQKELFAQTFEIETSKAQILKDILPKINQLGFEIEEFGGNTFIINGVPVNLETNMSIAALIELTVDQYIDNIEFQLGVDENLSRSLAVSASIKRGKSLSVVEMKKIIDQLFACENPYKSPTGRKCFVSFELEDLIKKFI
jgi:DNA mismatch repair protein MutL